MSPIDVYPKGKARACSITQDGVISLPQTVLARLGWQPGIELALRYIPDPLTLLLWQAPPERDGFKLGYLSRNGEQTQGGKVTCSAFINQVVRPRISLPQPHIPPAYLQHPPYELGLLFAPPAWQRVALTMSGCETIPADEVGVYRILGKGERVLRIGQGKLADRLQTHLKDAALVRQGQQAEYYALDKADAVILEKVLLALYEARHDALPPFNAIRA